MPPDAPVKMPPDAPVKMPPDAPVVAPAETAPKPPSDTPSRLPEESPTKVPADTPLVAPGDASGPTPSETPVEWPTEGSEITPTEQPTTAPPPGDAGQGQPEDSAPIQPGDSELDGASSFNSSDEEFLLFGDDPNSEKLQKTSLGLSDASDHHVTLSMSAGDGFDYPWGAWTSISWAESEDDFVTTAFESSRYGIFVGADFSPIDGYIFGLALGYDNTDTDTTFNSGNSTSESLTLVPYMGVLLGDWFSADLSTGFSRVWTDQFRTDASERITSDFRSSRYFISGNVNANTYLGDWLIGGTVGAQWAKDVSEEFVESIGIRTDEQKSKLGTAKLGVNTSYYWEDMEFFGFANYSYDYSKAETEAVEGELLAPNDKDSTAVGLGVRWYPIDGFTFSGEWNTILGLENFSENSFNILLRYDY